MFFLFIILSPFLLDIDDEKQQKKTITSESTKADYNEQDTQWKTDNIFNEDGNLGGWQDDKRHGQGTYTYPNDDKNNCEWQLYLIAIMGLNCEVVA